MNIYRVYVRGEGEAEFEFCDIFPGETEDDAKLAAVIDAGHLTTVAEYERKHECKIKCEKID